MTPEATLELISAPVPALQEELTAGRIYLALCDPSYLAEPLCWTARLLLIWAVGPGIGPSLDPLPLVLFFSRASGAYQCSMLWRPPDEVGASLSKAADWRAYKRLSGPGSASPLCSRRMWSRAQQRLVRRPGTDGNPLINAVEEVLRRLI
jgi:hypothetical protein